VGEETDDLNRGGEWPVPKPEDYSSYGKYPPTGCKDFIAAVAFGIGVFALFGLVIVAIWIAVKVLR